MSQQFNLTNKGKLTFLLYNHMKLDKSVFPLFLNPFDLRIATCIKS